jgi:hypothetical protein
VKLRVWHGALALGVLGAFGHAAGHHLFDNLYVANMHMLLGVYLGFLLAAAAKIGSTSKVEYI